MMRQVFLVWVGCGILGCTMAQELPEGASEIEVKIGEAPKVIPPSQTLTPHVSEELEHQETSLFVSSDEDDEVDQMSLEDTMGLLSAAEDPQSADSNQVARSTADFLVDTGIQYQEDGELEEAEQAYLRALEENPENPEITLRLSTVYLLTDRHEKAIPLLKDLSEAYPDSEVIYNNLAWAYATGRGASRNIPEALRCVREALLNDPISYALWNTLAEAYYGGGDYEKALRSADHAIDLMVMENPENPDLASYQQQRKKIKRAMDAVKIFDLD